MSLPERIKHLAVHAFSEEAGTLQQPAHFEFCYTGTKPVSLTMDVRPAPYNYGSLHPVFAQNLPEGYVRRYIHEKLIRHADVNDLYLLAIQGSKGIGHLAFESELRAEPGNAIALNDILHWREKEGLFPHLLERYYLNGLLSGVQPKVMVPTGEKSTITQGDVIVKTFDEEYDLLTVNEYICMSAAKAVGLNPPKFWLSDDKTCFVIERFDIEDGEQLAFEDFTVLMGKTNDQKYQSSYEALLRAIADFTQSPAEVERGYRYIVFNCLIGNGDAHLKNFAIQYDITRNHIRLAPPYDITHTLIYQTLDNNLALKLGGAKSFPHRKELTRLGLDAGIKHPQKIIDAIADKLQDYLSNTTEIELMPELRPSLLKTLAAACTGSAPIKHYRHDKRRKHP